jgi:hypothetical protein
MRVLSELLLNIAFSGLAPSSDRGTVALSSTGAVLGGSAAAWLLVTSADPLSNPAWGIDALAGSIAWGVGGVLLTLLYMRRNRSDRLFGIVNVMINTAAVAIPLLWLIAR